MRNTTKITVSIFGTIVGLMGIEHGIGEVLQGNVAPGGLFILSWPESQFFSVLAGEPAMTIIPNLIVTGILTIFVSLVFLVWTIMFVGRKKSGLVMIILSIVMLLFGGGFGPPLLGIIVGVTTTKMNSPVNRRRKHISTGPPRFLNKLWFWSLTACLIAWLLLFPGISILAYFFGVNNPALIPVLFFSALGLLLLTIFSGFTRDAQIMIE